MKCRQYPLSNPDGVCIREARWIVEETPLCTYHAEQRPLKIVLADYERFSKWIALVPVPEGQTCVKGCLNKYGDSFDFDEPGPAVYTVNGSSPLCLYHTQTRVMWEAQHDNYLKRLISVEPIDFWASEVD